MLTLFPSGMSTQMLIDVAAISYQPPTNKPVQSLWPINSIANINRRSYREPGLGDAEISFIERVIRPME